MSGGNNPDRDPNIRCIRKRPGCNHERREHGPDRCFGVTFAQGVAGDCHCKSYIAPLDPAKYPRQGENVHE